MTGRLVPSGAAIMVAAGFLMQQSVEGQVRATGKQSQVQPAAVAKAWTPPVTSFGDPDLQGVWLNNSATPLERPEVLKGKLRLTDDEVAELQQRADRLFSDGNTDVALGDAVFLAALANLDEYKNPDATQNSLDVPREFDNRTSLIVDPPDGRIPPLTLQARQKLAATATARQRPTGPEDLANPIRCLTWGVPRLVAGNPYTSYYQIIQSPGYVVLYLETDARIIPLGRPHLPARIRHLNGDSIGRWEGNTLVVDTTNFSPQSNFRGASEQLHVIERFTRVAPDRLHYEITIDDPTTWTRSWTVDIRLKLTQDRLYEYACHEGNYEVMRGILSAARIGEGR